jgi:hypothetical protein
LLRLAAGSTGEAEVLLKNAYDMVVSQPGGVPRSLLEGLARVARAQGREEEAQAYESRMEE